jgi:uncharacterized protein (TIGR02453 family)
MSFTGFGSDAIAWFEGLERDNSKRYFDATRAAFAEQVREPFELMLEELADELGGQVHVFRQNRDIRFSPDKSPYKTNTYGIVHSRPGSAAGCYASISSRGLYAGTGYYQMASDQLDRYHPAVLDDRSGPSLESAIATIASGGLELNEPALKTAPRGLPRDHPRTPLLRYKSLFAGRLLAPDDTLAGREPVRFVAATWSAAQPLVAWLDDHVGGSSLPPERRR